MWFYVFILKIVYLPVLLKWFSRWQQALSQRIPKSHLLTLLFAISGDNVNDQEKFVNEYGIPYLHLSDPSKETCKKYAGLNFVGLPKRSTFVIDKSGMIRKIFRNIDVEKHGQEIASFLENLH